jgi:hypothetical protein
VPGYDRRDCLSDYFDKDDNLDFDEDDDWVDKGPAVGISSTIGTTTITIPTKPCEPAS